MKTIIGSIALFAVLANLLVPQQYSQSSACCNTSASAGMCCHSCCAPAAKRPCCEPTVVKLRDGDTTEGVPASESRDESVGVAEFVPTTRFVPDWIEGNASEALPAINPVRADAVDVLVRHSRLNI